MINNKYYRWYMEIIERAKNETRPRVGHEHHHVLPRCMGGDNSSKNLVRLTLREHYICHLLLPKFTQGIDREKLKFALWCFVNKWGRKTIEVRMTSKVYEKLKLDVAIQSSKMNAGRSPPAASAATRKKLSEGKLGNKNPLFGKYGEQHPSYGKKRPGIGGRKKGTLWSENEREVQANIRAVPGYYDYLKDPQRGEKISRALRGKVGTATGKVWYNDGATEHYGTCVPAGYTAGRLITNAAKKGLRWFNNGVQNRQFREGLQPKGFVHGRISKK